MVQAQPELAERNSEGWRGNRTRGDVLEVDEPVEVPER